MSRNSRFNYSFFANIYNNNTSEGEICYIKDISSLSNILISNNYFIDIILTESFFCGKYLIFKKNIIPVENRHKSIAGSLGADYILVNIKCK
jgi:hypothetical protein